MRLRTSLYDGRRVVADFIIKENTGIFKNYTLTVTTDADQDKSEHNYDSFLQAKVALFEMALDYALHNTRLFRLNYEPKDS